jgi:hypothetical protein
MYKPLLYLINILHLLLILFIVITPFLNTNYYLLIHIIIVPFIILHWLTNSNVCALTIGEYYLREKITGVPVQNQDSFFARLVEPVYDFKKNNQAEAIIIYSFTLALLGLSFGKLLMKKYRGEIKSWWDLLRMN